MRKMKLPTLKDLESLIRSLKPEIQDDYRSEGGDDSDVPCMDVTIGWTNDGTGAWSYQTGDNSFTGGAYGYRHWAVTTIDRESNARDVAKDLQGQLADLAVDDVDDTEPTDGGSEPLEDGIGHQDDTNEPIDDTDGPPMDLRDPRDGWDRVKPRNGLRRAVRRASRKGFKAEIYNVGQRGATRIVLANAITGREYTVIETTAPRAARALRRLVPFLGNVAIDIETR